MVGPTKFIKLTRNEVDQSLHEPGTCGVVDFIVRLKFGLPVFINKSKLFIYQLSIFPINLFCQLHFRRVEIQVDEGFCPHLPTLLIASNKSGLPASPGRVTSQFCGVKNTGSADSANFTQTTFLKAVTRVADTYGGM